MFDSDSRARQKYAYQNIQMSVPQSHSVIKNYRIIVNVLIAAYNAFCNLYQDFIWSLMGDI